MAKPDGWAKAWGLAAHVEPAGCMTCGVRGAQGPKDVSQTIAPQGYGATNPDPRSSLQLQTSSVDFGGPGVKRGVPVTQPAANGMIRVHYNFRPTSYIYDPLAAGQHVSHVVVIPHVDGQLMHSVPSSNVLWVLEVSPGRHYVSGPDGVGVTAVDAWAGFLTDLDYREGSDTPTITRTRVFDPNNPQQAVPVNNGIFGSSETYRVKTLNEGSPIPSPSKKFYK